MKQGLKELLAALAGVDPEDIEAGSNRKELEDLKDVGGASGADETDGMDDGIPDFVQDATNIYRTKRFIVKQRLTVARQGMESAKLVSMDTYYLRTSKRDALYDSIFGENRDLNGKRIPAMSYFRSYRE